MGEHCIFLFVVKVKKFMRKARVQLKKIKQLTVTLTLTAGTLKNNTHIKLYQNKKMVLKINIEKRYLKTLLLVTKSDNSMAKT